MFAPNHHPAMKHVAPVRKELGVRTIFNILGPLTNPAGAPNILMGVFHPDLVGIQVRVLQRLGAEHAMVVYGRDGMDEISLGAATMVGELKDGEIREYEIHPEDFGLPMASNRALKVETPERVEGDAAGGARQRGRPGARHRAAERRRRAVCGERRADDGRRRRAGARGAGLGQGAGEAATQFVAATKERLAHEPARRSEGVRTAVHARGHMSDILDRIVAVKREEISRGAAAARPCCSLRRDAEQLGAQRDFVARAATQDRRRPAPR